MATSPPAFEGTRGASSALRPGVLGAPLVVSGASGRLGRAVVERAQRSGHPVGGAFASPTNPGLGRPLRELGISAGDLRLSDPGELSMLLAPGSIYVACAPAGVERELLPIAADSGCPVVLASTGFDAPELARLQERLRGTAVVQDANFSIGWNWWRAALARAPPIPAGFDLGVVEAHRRAKRDRPSATARALSADLATGTALPEESPAGAAVPSAPGGPEPLSLRLGDLPGVHQLWLGGGAELLRFEHLVLDRGAFADGILLAARWLSTARAPGWYRMIDVLDDRPGAR